MDSAMYVGERSIKLPQERWRSKIVPWGMLLIPSIWFWIKNGRNPIQGMCVYHPSPLLSFSPQTHNSSPIYSIYLSTYTGRWHVTQPLGYVLINSGPLWDVWIMSMEIVIWSALVHLLTRIRRVWKMPPRRVWHREEKKYTYMWCYDMIEKNRNDDDE